MTYLLNMVLIHKYIDLYSVSVGVFISCYYSSSLSHVIAWGVLCWKLIIVLAAFWPIKMLSFDWRRRMWSLLVNILWVEVLAGFWVVSGIFLIDWWILLMLTSRIIGHILSVILTAVIKCITLAAIRWWKSAYRQHQWLVYCLYNC